MSSFSLCVARECFFPAQSLLLTYWRQEPACQNFGCWTRQQIGSCWVFFGGVLLEWRSMMPSLSQIYHHVSSLRANAQFFLCRSYEEGCWEHKQQGKQKNWFVMSLFGGGVLLGIMLAEHDARPLLKRSSCVIVLEQTHNFLFCLCAVTNGGGVGIVDGYVPAKDIIPKNPYRVLLRYRLVKYRENTDRFRTEIPNWDATLSLSPFLSKNAATAIHYPPRLILAMPPMQPFKWLE